ncbi:hypothetical protein POVCU2_0028120 [Plasmodium ovale curtisi]|uniref:Uncharacterized protein n=2 Tax=Plasmodium ovale TaxID=36330 RepID=A0A1A8W0X8_PLAOA|nr:hypothetical protein POVCU2_0028120 [Plasmodium ovale curtisi]SBT01307.1 hypothetical protein POVCU1_065950 [Plasmodium ovale curtisi]
MLYSNFCKIFHNSRNYQHNDNNTHSKGDSKHGRLLLECNNFHKGIDPQVMLFDDRCTENITMRDIEKLQEEFQGQFDHFLKKKKEEEAFKLIYYDQLTKETDPVNFKRREFKINSFKDKRDTNVTVKKYQQCCQPNNYKERPTMIQTVLDEIKDDIKKNRRRKYGCYVDGKSYEVRHKNKMLSTIWLFLIRIKKIMKNENMLYDINSKTENDPYSIN